MADIYKYTKNGKFFAKPGEGPNTCVLFEVIDMDDAILKQGEAAYNEVTNYLGKIAKEPAILVGDVSGAVDKAKATMQSAYTEISGVVSGDNTQLPKQTPAESAATDRAIENNISGGNTTGSSEQPSLYQRIKSWGSKTVTTMNENITNNSIYKQLQGDISNKYSGDPRAYIVLPMPVDLANKYTLNWETKSSEWKAWLAGNGTDMLKTIGIGVLGKFAGTSDITKSVAGSFGLAVNPYSEQFFQNVGFRTFVFNYVFGADSYKDSENIAEIIKQFKYYSHPNFIGNKRFFKYPSLFKISFKRSQRIMDTEIEGNTKSSPSNNRATDENKYLFKTKPCALTGIDIKYNEAGDWVEYIDGAPITIALSLTFTEINILTQDDIRDGGY